MTDTIKDNIDLEKAKEAFEL